MFQSIDPIIFTAYILAALSIITGVYVLAPKQKMEEEESEFSPLIHRGQMGAKREELKDTYPLYRLFLPLISGLAFFINKFPLEGMRANLRKKIVQAGNPGAFTPDEYLSLHLISLVTFPVFIGGVVTMALGSFPLWGVFATGLFGFIYPSIWLSDTVTKRMRKISLNLPYTLDLLTLSIEAGLDFISSVERIVTKRETQGPLAEEMFQMLQELKMGKTRREALRDMARRINLDNLNTVVASLIQADQLGTPLGPVLRVQAEMLRVRRSQMAEKKAMQAPVKMLFPLLFIFAAVFLLLLSPIIIKFVRGEIL